MAIAGVACVLSLLVEHPGYAARQNEYIGSKACADCHQTQYDSFKKYARKANTFHAVEVMAPKLTPEEVKECYACHATGYGQPGGFKSKAETPELAEAGCEVCHGPGKAHAESGDPKDIKAKLTMKDCTGCHNESRVKSFNFKPLLFSGAH